jgi:hypothetical protein
MANLYEINQELLNCIDLETGEIIDTEKFDQLQLEKNDKLENVALWYKNLLAEAAAFKAEKDVFAEKQKRAEAKADSLKKYLDTALHGSKFNTVKVDIAYRKSTSVEVIDQEAIPEQYLRTVTTVSPDKTEIAKALKVGELVEGVTLKETQNIQIK